MRYILGSFFDEHPSRNWLSGPSGPCQDCYKSQHDHVYIFTPSTAARVRARDSMMFSSKPCAGEVWESSPRTSFKSGKGLRVARGAHHLKTATLNSLRQPLSWQWVQTISVWTRVLGSDNYSVFVNGNNPAFYGNHWEPSSCCTGCPKSKGVS